MRAPRLVLQAEQCAVKVYAPVDQVRGEQLPVRDRPGGLGRRQIMVVVQQQGHAAGDERGAEGRPGTRRI